MNGVDGYGGVFDDRMANGVVTLLSGITTAADIAVPMYSPTLTHYVPAAKTVAVRPDDCPAYTIPFSRKRVRETADPLVPSFPNVLQNRNREKLRMSMEERGRRHSRRIAESVEDGIMKKLKAKEEEIEQLGKVNRALEERVKSLSMENQIWRDLAQSNEATAIALRWDLEQVLAQDRDEQHYNNAASDGKSSCGSNFEEIDSSRGDWLLNLNGEQQRSGDRICRSCGEEEASALVLPCRHLCLCTVCESSLRACPVCNSIKTASLHLNLSPSF